MERIGLSQRRHRERHSYLKVFGHEPGRTSSEEVQVANCDWWHF